MTPEQVIEFRDRELTAQANSRTLWQDTSKYLYPYVNITSEYEPGSRRTDDIFDITPMLDAEDMVSNLKHILFPAGQRFFDIKIGGNKLPDNIQRYISILTESAHEQIYNSNFITELDENLRSLIIFGPSPIYCDWNTKDGLYYRAAIVGTYQLIENSKKLVDGIIITMKYNPSQAIEEFGEENVGKSVLEAAKDNNKKNEKFEFIYLIMPRNKINPLMSQKISKNMPWMEIIVGVKDKITVYEGGYRSFPYPTARWKRPGIEKDGRGIGTEILPQVQVLQALNRDFNEVSNKWANPAMDVLYSFEGPYRTFPGARNNVASLPSAQAVDRGLNGNFNTTEESLDRQAAIISRAFMKNAFSPLEDLTGDRRTTLEIRERMRSTWPKIGTPVARLWYEQISPLVERSILLLIRHGAVPPPPPELQGVNFGLEFVSPFALELRSQQSKAFQEWAFIVGEMEERFPGATDNVDSDDAIQRLGRTLGVNTEDMASEEQRQEKRKERARKEQQQLELAALQAGGQAYGQTTGAPEEGSAAEAVMGAL